jgi:hypothetical protein
VVVRRSAAFFHRRKWRGWLFEVEASKVDFDQGNGRGLMTRLYVSYCRTENWVKVEDALIIMAGEGDYKSPMEDADVACEVESNLIKRKASSSWCDVGANLPDYLNLCHVSHDNHQSIYQTLPPLPQIF